MRTMAGTRGKRIAVGAVAAGGAVLLGLLIAARGWIEEEILIRRLEKHDREAVVRLGELRSVRAVPYLTALLRRGIGVLLEPCAEALSRIGKPAVGPLKELLEDRSAHPEVRAYAAEALGKVGPDAAPALGLILELANDLGPDWVSRQRALIALGRLGVASPEVVGTLATALADRNSDTSGHAARALAALGTSAREAVPGVVKALEQPWEEDVGGWFHRAGLLKALLLIGPPPKSAVPLLVRHLSHRGHEVRLAAAECLGTMGRDAAEAEPELRKLLSDGNPQVQKAAGSALRCIDVAARS